MTIDELRRAAQVLREGPLETVLTPDAVIALADALDHAADHFYGYLAPHLDEVARLILGDAS